MHDDAAPPAEPAWVARAAQILPTEHFTLQGARGATISKSTGRASLYLAALSSTLVALGFIGQSSGKGTPFDVFALVLLPTIFFLGVATVTRLTQYGMEDITYGRGINRIRHFNLEFVPGATRYFILSANDDSISVMRNMGLNPGRRQMFLTIAGTIGVINSVVGGAFLGLLTSLLDPPLAVSVVVGAAVFAVSVVGHMRLEESIYAASTGDPTVHFPSSDAHDLRELTRS